MRIAVLADFPIHVIPGYESRNPNAHYATWLPQLAEVFREQRDLQFTWIGLGPAYSNERIESNGQVFEFHTSPRRFRALAAHQFERRLIRKRLAELRPDLVHAWGSEGPYALAATDSAWKSLVSMQGILTEYSRVSKMPMRVHLQAWFERQALRKARWVSVESTWGREKTAPLAPSAEIRLIEYGAHHSFFEVKWEPDPSAPAAVYVGTTEERKGLSDLIAAFKSDQLKDAELWIVGDQNTRAAEMLKADSGANVKWLGRMGRQETAEKLRRAWCLALPTRADTSPNVVKEARVIGLPVVTTSCGGQRDYIEDGVNGFIVEPRQVSELASRLALLLRDFGLARRMGAERWEAHREIFRPERTASGFIDYYRSILGA